MIITNIEFFVITAFVLGLGLYGGFLARYGSNESMKRPNGKEKTKTMSNQIRNGFLATEFSME